jgi:3-hydroxyacyl-CoA dehydrogenase
MATEVVRYETREGIAILTIDSPPVNLLTGAVRRGIDAGLNRAHADPDIAAVVITAAGRAFIAGADISEFGQTPVAPSLDELFERLANSRKPLVAAINGVALGGGMEVALCCDYRLASPGGSMGLPEVKLGLLPGGGGTQRLPRLIGAGPALRMLLFGDPVPATTAATLGIVDEVIVGNLVDGAVAFTKSLLERGAPLRKIDADNSRVVGDRGKSEVLQPIYQEALAAMPGRFALEMIVQCVEAAITEPEFAAGMQVERRCFAHCMAHPQHAALKHLFFAERECAKIPGISRDTPARTVMRAAFDTESGPESLALRQRLQRAGVELRCVTAKDAFLRTVDLVVLDTATGPEFIAGLAPTLPAETIVFSVASEHELDELAEVTGRPDRTLGVMLSPSGQVIEFARGHSTSDTTLATAVALCKRIGVVPIVSCRGQTRYQHRYSVGGRLLAAHQRAIDALVHAGVSPEAITRCLSAHGFPTVESRESLQRKSSVAMPDGEILIRCLRAWADEGQRLCDELVVARSGDVDITAVRGYGFPELYGGPMWWRQQTREREHAGRQTDAVGPDARGETLTSRI